MYWKDHQPPHFHAIYGSFEALIDINNLSVLNGKLPRRAIELVLDWAELHQQELLDNWNLCRNNQTPNMILPLQ